MITKKKEVESMLEVKKKSRISDLFVDDFIEDETSSSAKELLIASEEDIEL